MILPTEDTASKILHLEGLEYAVLDLQGKVVGYSPGLSDFISESSVKTLLGQSFDTLFPELFGFAPVLEEIRSGKQPELKLERSHRPNLRGREGYITLRIISNEDGWLLIASDDTEIGLLEQRITQQRNELSLLANQLERMRYQRQSET